MRNSDPKPSPLQVADKLMLRYMELYYTKADATESYKAAIEPLDEEMIELKEQLFQYTEANPKDFNGTLQLSGGTIGYKLGVKSIYFPLDGADDLSQKYLALVKKELPEAIIETVDSKAVIGALRFFPVLANKLDKLGIEVKQPENFIVTPKR